MVRTSKDPGGSRGKDRISELPEPLIHLILSFLPSQCVVSTSVLSKRWRYIWTSVPLIDLRELKFPEIVKLEDTNEEFERVGNLYSLLYQSVEDFVDKKLSLHHETRDIKKFYISADDFYASERLEEWIPALFTGHNLEEFELTSESYTDIGFFHSSWTVSLLVILELDLWDQVFLPDAGNFPNLKICRLRNVELYISEDLTQQFFSNLPVLEELELTNCLWHMWDILLISAPVLKYLFITGPHERAEFDDIPVYKFKINIFAPNLQSLRYFDVAAEDYILHRFESLVDAQIDFDRLGTPLPQEKDPIATKFLQKLCNVKHLEISGRTFKELLFPDDLSSNWPTFHNLVHLELTSSTTVSMELLNFLNISPYLETIVFAEDFGVSSSSIDMVPQCMLLHLKSVTFGRFHGCREELNAVKAFLKNARVLRRMIIRFNSYSLSTDEQNKVMKKLLNFPRGSSSCIIEVS